MSYMKEKKQLLVFDAGNTNTVFGVYDGDSLIGNWRIRTEKDRTADEYVVLMDVLLRQGKVDPASIGGVIISCVVPPMLNSLERFSLLFFGVNPLIVEPGIKTKMPIRIDSPKEVGADRLVNALAAYERYKCSLIVVDFGTATTFDGVSAKGEYLGGSIAPGVMISCEALFQRASKLPRVEIFSRPKAVLGKDTVSAMSSGIIFGFAGMVDGIVKRMKMEIQPTPKVVATGGLARILEKECECIDEIVEYLTLEGLRIIYERNQ